VRWDFGAFYNRFKTASTDATYLSAVDSSLTQTLGGWTGGVVGVVPNNKNQPGWGLPVAPGVGTPRTDASVLAYPSSALTRATGTGYNLCAPLYNAATYRAQ